MCPHVMELMFKIHEISRFYYAFIISRFSLYSLFYIFFKFFNFLPILKYNFIVYLYSFSAVFFITQNITHKNILLYYGHSPIFSPFSFNLNVLTLPSPSTLDNTLSTDRKSTRLNSSHVSTSYAVFCLKKKKSRQIKRR